MSESAEKKHRHNAGPDNSKKERDKGRIISFQDLLDEEQRLIMEVKRNKTRVAEDFNIVKAKLQPANQALNFMNRLTGGTGKPGVISHGVDIALDLLSKKYLFRKSNWFVTLAGSYVVRGISQLFLSKARSKQRREDRAKHNGADQTTGEEIPNQ